MPSMVPEYYASIPYVGTIVTSLVLALFTFFYYTPGWSYRAKWEGANVFAAPFSLVVGGITAYGMVNATDENYVTSTLFAVSATALAYIFAQTVVTDVVSLKVDRFTLMLAQGIVFTAAGVYYLYHSDALLTMNLWLAGLFLVVFIVLWQITNRYEQGTSPRSWLQLSRNLVASGGIVYAAFHISKSFEFEVWFWVLFMFLAVVLLKFSQGIGGGDSRTILLGFTASVPVAGVIPALLGFLVYTGLTTVFALFSMIRHKKTTVQSLKDVGNVGLPAAPMISGVYLALILFATADIVFDWQVLQGYFR